MARKILSKRIDELQRIVIDQGLLKGVFALGKHMFPTPINGIISLIEIEIESDFGSNLSLKKKIDALKKGFTTEQYCFYNFYKYNYKSYISEYVRQAYTKELNEKPEILDYKKKFFDYIGKRDYDNLLPQLYGVIKEGDFIGKENINDIFKEKRKLVIKPNRGSGGREVYICEKINENYLINGNEFDSINTFIKDLDDFIVTEYSEQSIFLSNIYPKSANTIRFLTINPDDEEPFIADAALRIGTEKSGFVDNRSLGGLTVNINLRTGRLSKAAECLPSGEVKWHTTHPDTKSKIEDLKVPFWNMITKKILNFVKDFPEFRYVGWDVLLTEKDNFVIIEGNSKPGLIVFQVHHPLLKKKKIKDFFIDNRIHI